MTRVLVVVGRASSGISQSTATPRSSRDPSSSADSRSVPTRPTRSGVAPSAARLAAVLAAPPGRTVARCLRTTGTGASGESRDASPHQYLSRITSPITRIRWPRKCRKTAEALDTSLNVAYRPSWDRPSAFVVCQPSLKLKHGCLTGDTNLSPVPSQWIFAPALLRPREQARAVQRIPHRHHHPALRVLRDIEAVAEVVSRPQMVEYVPARRIARGVGLGHRSPGGGDALLQHARHPVSSPPRRTPT